MSNYYHIVLGQQIFLFSLSLATTQGIVCLFAFLVAYFLFVLCVGVFKERNSMKHR